MDPRQRERSKIGNLLGLGGRRDESRAQYPQQEIQGEVAPGSPEESRNRRAGEVGHPREERTRSLFQSLNVYPFSQIVQAYQRDHASQLGPTLRVLYEC